MTVNELIKKLKMLPPDTVVCVADWRKHIHNANDEPQGHGLYSDFKVGFVTEDTNTPFIALSFENDDYKEDGTPDFGSSLAASIEQELR